MILNNSSLAPKTGRNSHNTYDEIQTKNEEDDSCPYYYVIINADEGKY